MRTWLLQQREKKGFTQAQLAQACFIDRSYYSQIENGTRTPSAQVAKAIAELLEFNPSTFFFNDDNKLLFSAFKGAPIVVAHNDTELRYQWLFNPTSDYDPQSVIGKRDDELRNDYGTRQLIRLKQTVLETGKPMQKTIAFPSSGNDLIYLVVGRPRSDDDGNIIGVFTALIDITDALQIRNTEMEKKRLRALRRYNILDTPPDGAFDRIVALAARLFQVPISIISLVDTDRIWFKAHHGVDTQEIDRVPGLCASAILFDEP